MVKGGHGTYGFALGILTLDSKFARIPGDVGNATTYSFPVLYKIIPGASGPRVLGGDRSLLQPFLDGARELEAAGCRAITTSCGFLALFQKELAAEVNIPVFASSLLQVDLAWRMLRPDQKVGILTADKNCLTEQHFLSVGCQHVPKVVYGLEESVLPRAFNSEDGSYEVAELRQAMEAQAERMIREHPEVGAIVLECTNMPPFAAAVQKKTGRPVFDYTTLANFIYSTLYRREFEGHM